MIARRSLLPLLLLALAGCDDKHSGIVEALVLGVDGPWYDRDVIEDPAELVDGVCCNDERPFPLPADTSLDAVINPAEDLDYYAIEVTDAEAGILYLWPLDADLNLRLFNMDLSEYELVIDTLPPTETLYPFESPPLWIPFYGPGAKGIVLVHGDEANYSLGWERIVPTVGLEVLAPATGATWARGEEQRIRWVTPYSQMDVILLKGPVMVASLKRDIRFSEELNWLPSGDLEPGNDYRIAVLPSGTPDRMEFSDAFTIE